MADYAMQYNFKQGEVMINVPIMEDESSLMGAEIEDKLGVVYAKAELSASVQAELNARGVAAGILGAKTVSSGPAPSGGASGAPSGGTGNPLCDCGVERQWKQGTSKQGNDYKGYFCVNNRCKPDFRR